MNWWMSIYWLGEVLSIRLIWVIVWISLYLNRIQIYWNFCCLLFFFFPMLWQIGKFFLPSTGILFNRCFSLKWIWEAFMFSSPKVTVHSVIADSLSFIILQLRQSMVLIDLPCINLLPFTWIQKISLESLFCFTL